MIAGTRSNAGGVTSALPLESTSLFFNIEINFRRGAVLGYLLTIEFHFQFRYPRPLHTSNGLCGFCDGVFRSLSKTLLDVPTTSITFCAILFSFDLDSVQIVLLRMCPCLPANAVLLLLRLTTIRA